MDLIVLLIETVGAGSPFPILMNLSWIMPKRWGPECILPFYIIKWINEKMSGKRFCTFLFSSRFFSSSLPPSSSSFHLAEIFCSLPFLLFLRFVSWVFTLVFHVCFGWLLMRVVQVIRNVLLSWIHVYLLRNIKDLKLSTSEYERIEKCRK